jgi:predicted AlkP superfamily pyrophosphatase or phosphodiesterase
MRLVLPLLLTACGAAPTELVKPTPPEHARVVMISIDGMMPETYTDPDRLGLQVPTLRGLVAHGAFARDVESVFPTVTYPAHTTMVTGVPPAMHGITSNRPRDPAGKNADGWNWYSESIAVPTLWNVAPGKVAIITWPVSVGADVAYRVPEYWRAGTPDDQKLLRSLSTPGLLDKVAKEYPELWSKLTPPDVQDDAQFAIAKYLLAHEDPSLLLMHVWATDDAQHEHGPRSAEAKAAFEHVDALLGDLLATLEHSPDWDRTLVLVVSDHGFAPIEQEIELDVLFAQKKISAYCVANGGSAYVYTSDEKARDAIAELGARVSVVDPTTLGGDGDAAFAVVAAPGFSLGTQRTGQLYVDKPNHGTHGFLPTDANMKSSFLATGGRVKPADLGSIRMLDIAPTAARWLGVALPSAVGTPLDLAR